MNKRIVPLKGIGAPLNIFKEKLYYVSTNTDPNNFVDDDGYVRNRYNKAIAFKGIILESKAEDLQYDKLGEEFTGYGTLYARKKDVVCRNITFAVGDILVTTRKSEWLIHEVKDYDKIVMCFCKRRTESAHEIMEIVDFE